MSAEELIYALLQPVEREEGQKKWLAGISLDRGLVWQLHDLPGDPKELRIARDGNAFISTVDTIWEVNPEGKVDRSIQIAVAPNQEIGSFVLLEDGFLVSIQGKREPAAAVIRTDWTGRPRWTTDISVAAIAYQGIVTMARQNDWEPRQSPPWKPQNWLSVYDNEILVSGQSALVSYHEMPRSGIGMSYHLDLETGTINWTTDPAPYESICCAGDGRFLIGYQGYGTFETKLYDPDGTVVGQWPSAGRFVIREDQRIFLIEMNNARRKLYCTELLPDSQVNRGPQIPGYYIVSPAVDEFGRMVFFRNNRLFMIDPGQTVSSLPLDASHDEKLSFGIAAERILLRDGLIVLSVADTLYLLESNLGQLAASPWPCTYGNLERNPVIPA